MDTRQQKNPTVSTDDWYTPKWIIDTLGPFDLGPYMFDCDSDNVGLDEHGARQVGDKVRLGLQGKCNDFIDDGGK